MKILVGTPVYDGKMYSIPRWLDSVKATGLDLLIVDNSETKLDIPLETNWEHIHIGRLNDEENDLARSRELIRQKAVAGYDYWLSWECDILFGKDVLDTLIYLSAKADVIHYKYPARGVGGEQDGIGCSLISTKILKEFTWLDHSAWGGADGWLLNWLVEKGYTILEVRNILDIKHLDQ